MNTRTIIASVAAATMLAGTVSAQCDSQKRSASARTVSLSAMGSDVVDTAVEAGSFKTLAAALTAADLVQPLKGDGPFTVFAPTDAAFAKLPAGTVETLLKPENKGLLTAILTYHVVPGRVDAESVMNMTEATTLNSQRISITIENGVRIDDANVVKADIACSNGIIHVIDSVILPSTDDLIELAAKAGSFETLAAAIKTAGLASVLTSDGPFTVFAPTDAAFANLPAGTVDSLLLEKNRHQLVDILKYHVVPGRVYADQALSAQTAETAEGSRVRFRLRGGNLMVNDANILNADIEASNGVVHVIDRVIMPG
jgi:uncharacterized surface protein with fasciclin (FAS1) repeats